MSLLLRLLVGVAGTGLAIWLAFLMPLSDRADDWLVDHRRVDDALPVVLLLLAASGWIVGAVAA